jgi:predicted NUDIX family NTP pyrophosphohydrolase
VKRSAGVLLRRSSGEVLLVHPGGPFWARRDAGAWSIPKGEHDDDEDAEVAARREFEEELGVPAPADLTDLGTVRQKNRKEVRAFLGSGDLDVSAIVSNTFTIEWPPRSGRQAVAREKLNPAQAEFLDRLP